jgi:hypothetical protein
MHYGLLNIPSSLRFYFPMAVQAAAQLDEALRYKPEYRGFDS